MIKAIKQLKNKIIRIIARCVLQEIDNTGKMQKIKAVLYGDEVIKNVDRLQEYGLETYPIADDQTEGIIVFQGGNRDQGICLKLNSRKYRPTDLSEGDVCLYAKDLNDGFKNRVWIKPASNEIEITQADNMKVTLNTNGITIEDGTNDVVLDKTSVKINGTALEILP